MRSSRTSSYRCTPMHRHATPLRWTAPCGSNRTESGGRCERTVIAELQRVLSQHDYAVAVVQAEAGARVFVSTRGSECLREGARCTKGTRTPDPLRGVHEIRILPARFRLECALSRPEP